MASNRLRVTELDFDTIKSNLKAFLKSQSQFQDYDFEGSGLNVLIDLLAYNTHYNAYYLNMIANEAFLDTAILRDSIVSHAKSLGYIPQSTKASIATIDLTITPSIEYVNNVLTLERGFTFRSSLLDNKSYNFVLLDNVSVNKTNDVFVFQNLQIYQGQLKSYSYTYNADSNPKQVFTLPDTNVDTTTLRVQVKQNGTSTDTQNYQLVTDVLDITGTSQVYFLQETRNLQYQIYFGDDVVGKALSDGNVVVVEYVSTDGFVANKSTDFVASSNIRYINSYDISVISSASGGADRESADEIKTNSMLQYSTQNRLVTIKDYESYIKKNYPVINSLSVWGGEDELPPVYGKVFISLYPKTGFFISETEKQRIINDIIRPKSIVSVQVELRDPEYLYIILKNKILYDKTKTLYTYNTLLQNINSVIDSYVDTNLNKFGATFSLSKVQSDISDVDSSIIGTQTAVWLEKRFTPILNIATDYTINFDTPLYRSTLIDGLKTTSFTVYDNYGSLQSVLLEETPASYTGITKIDVLDAGYGYTSTPTVTITGDGENATAVATIVNGKVVSINVTNRGTNYSKATITISGGGGFGASGVAVIDAKYGTLRTFYVNSNSVKKIVNENAGIIDYNSGTITLKNFKPISVNSIDGSIFLQIRSDSDMITSKRNIIITMDATKQSIINELVAI